MKFVGDKEVEMKIKQLFMSLEHIRRLLELY